MASESPSDRSHMYTVGRQGLKESARRVRYFGPYIRDGHKYLKEDVKSKIQVAVFHMQSNCLT